MRSQSSWNLSHVSPNARMAARVAARNEGITLGEWLTRQIVGEDHAEEYKRDFTQAFDQLDEQILDLASRFIEIEEQLQSDPLRDAVKKLHDGLTKLNTELVQVTGLTTIQSSTLAAQTCAIAGRLDEIRAEASQKSESLENDIEQIEGRLQTRDTAFESGMIRASADISAIQALLSEKSSANDQAIAQLECRLFQTTKDLEGLRSTVETTCDETADSIKALGQHLEAAFESSSSKSAKELDALRARIQDLLTDASGTSLDLDRRLEALSGQLLSRTSLVELNLAGLASDVKSSASRLADALRSAQDRDSAIADRIRSQEARFAHELGSRDADQAAFRSESLRSLGGLQQGLDTATAATANNFAAISELSDFAHSLKRIQNDGVDKADTLERGLAELRAKLDMASVDALKTFSALSDTRAELEEVSVRQAEDTAHTGGMLKALKEELLSLGAKDADKIAGVENSLAELREQSNQRISVLKTALDESNATFDASHAKSLEISGALEQRFARWVDKSGSDVFTLAEKFDTVENMLAQERANFADIGRATETRLAGLERGLLDIGGTFTTAQAAASESHGVLRQLLSQLADQSTGELRSLQTRVETIGGTFASHHGETAQATALMKDRINSVCQAVEDTEARQKELSNLLVASQEREVIATNAISALEEKLKLLDSRVQAAAAMHTEELARSSEAGEPVEQAHIAKGDSDEPAGRTAKDTDAEVKAEASAKSAEKSKDTGEADFDEWEYRDEKPQLVVPPAVQTAEAVAMKSMITPPITWQEEQAKRPEGPTQSECEGGNSPDFATTSVDLPPFFEPQLPQVDTLNTPREIVADDASENGDSAMDGVKDEPSISQSFISQARLSARNAAERADAERAELGAFRKYLGNSQDEASVARKLRKPAIQFGAAAALLAICFTTAKYVFDNQSVMPRAQAAIHEPSLRPLARKAAAVQTSALAVQALNAERPSSGQFEGTLENQTNKDNNSQSGKERSLGSVAANAGHNLDRISALALAGDANAQLQVGLLYLARDGEATSGSQAVKWLGLSANQGNAVAQYRLGALYAAGHGVPMDQVRAAQLYEKAASLGNRKAMYNLALAYVRGKGVSKNPTEAVRWFLKAANLGLLDAQFDLAVLYERGTGAPQSLLDAYRWYAIAAKSGDRESQQRVQTLATQLPAGDQAAAQKSADEFKASTVIPEANNPPSVL